MCAAYGPRRWKCCPAARSSWCVLLKRARNLPETRGSDTPTSQSHGAGQTESYVVRVPDADGKPAPLEGCFKIEDAEHFHAVA